MASDSARHRIAAGLVLLGAAIVALGDLAIRFAPAGTHVAAWWPAVGLAVAWGLRLGRGWLPAVVGVTWAAGVIANLSGGRDPGVAVLFSTANAIEVAIVCLAVMAWNPRGDLRQMSQLVALAGATALGALTAGSIAALTVASLLDGDPWVTLQAVAASHASAVLVFLPFGLRPHENSRRTSPLAALAAGTVLTVATLLVFAPNQRMPLVFLLYPLFVLTSLRMSLRTNAAHLIVVSTTATLACSAGWGPLMLIVESVGRSPEAVGTLLQALMVSVALMVYALRITVDSREVALIQARKARSRLTAVVGSAPATAIIQTDLDGVIQVFNQGAVNMLGHAEEDMVGRRTPAAFHDPDELAARAAELGIEPSWEVLVHEVREGRKIADRRDWTYLTADGASKLVSVVVSQVEDADGTPLGFVGIADDVGAQRQVEQLLVAALEHERRLAAELRVADDLKSQFVSAVSHELRTPMSSVLGYAELLGDEYGDVLDDAGRSYLDRITANGQRLLGLVDDLLRLSRLESGALALERAEVDLAYVARSAASVVAPLATDRGVTLQLEIPDLTAPALGDAKELENLTINLLTNAVKFTPPGGTVTLAVAQEGPPRVTVRDTGMGVPPDDVDRIFDRFHRGANAQEASIPGTGLGLSIVKAIVDRHGGEIHASSELGHGTEVTVTLPDPRTGEVSPQAIPPEPGDLLSAPS